jgi:hypothetical protein
MKLVLSALALLVSLASIGIACGPKEKFCYDEGMTCEMVKAAKEQADRQSEASDAGEEVCPMRFDEHGKLIPCD